MSREWITEEEIIAAWIEAKERFAQMADYIFCSPKEALYIKGLCGDKFTVISAPDVEEGRIYLVDKERVEDWMAASGIEDIEVYTNGLIVQLIKKPEEGEKNEDPLQMPEI